tara:strand:- start:559 stop:1668 length:1110 start_codon:yes stop_codon:yes gene_type:complete
MKSRKIKKIELENGEGLQGELRTTSSVGVRKPPHHFGRFSIETKFVALVALCVTSMFFINFYQFYFSPLMRHQGGKEEKISQSPVSVLPRQVDDVSVTPRSLTVIPRGLLNQARYELDEAPQTDQISSISIAILPDQLKKLPHVQQRKITFIKSTLPLILKVNALIEIERHKIVNLKERMPKGQKLSPADTAWLSEIADRYGLERFDLERFDLASLLKRVDIVPPSLALAQAAEESGWGTSRFAREGNALFGQRAYREHKKGIIPKNRPNGSKFRVRAFDRLIDGVKAYAHNLNSHFAYQDFRDRRANLRAKNDSIDGYKLAGSLVRYSERGEDYIDTIRVIMRENALQLFDSAWEGRRVMAESDGPGA